MDGLMKRRRPGRPVGSGERYSVSLRISVTPSMEQELADQAARHGYGSFSEYLRVHALQPLCAQGEPGGSA